ncbi:MAG: hypothetical protein ACJ74U_15155 [Jatrophihabitantaceae bacterium]
MNEDALENADKAIEAAQDARLALITEGGAVPPDGSGGLGLLNLIDAIEYIAHAISHLAARQP